MWAPLLFVLLQQMIFLKMLMWLNQNSNETKSFQLFKLYILRIIIRHHSVCESAFNLSEFWACITLLNNNWVVTFWYVIVICYLTFLSFCFRHNILSSCFNVSWFVLWNAIINIVPQHFSMFPVTSSHHHIIRTVWIWTAFV